MEIINNITPEEEMRLKRIDEDCKALHVLIPPKAFLEYSITGVDGKPRKKFKSLSKSWVRNAYTQIAQQLGGLYPTSHGSAVAGPGSLYFRCTDNTSRGVAFNFWASTNDWTGDAGDAYAGIIAGTDNTAEDFDDYILGSKCSHGTSTNQLQYGKHSAVGIWSTANKKWTATHTRVLTNSSSAPIDVKETGILIGVFTSPQLLINRDVLPATETVGVGESISITYTIEITFP